MDESARRDGTQKVQYGRGDRVNFTRPVAALDLQLALLDHLRTADWTQEVDIFTRTYTPAMDGDVISSNQVAFRDLFVQPGVRRALNGMAQFISAEMYDLVTEIAATMPPEMVFPTDLQFFEGLLVLGKKLSVPWHGVDEDHRLKATSTVLNIRAIAYSLLPEGCGVKVEDGTTIDDGIQIFLYTGQSDAVEFGDLGSLNPDSPLGRAPLVLADHFVWAFGTPWGEAKVGEVLSARHTSPKVAYIRRWLLALWRLMWQQILHPDPFKPDNAARKRALRAMPSRIDGDVLRVIRLRRIDETAEEWMPDHEGSGYELTHGYWRRAHWRTIHRDTDEERKVYVKGHAVRPDLPQADSYKVVSVER